MHEHIRGHFVERITHGENHIPTKFDCKRLESPLPRDGSQLTRMVRDARINQIGEGSNEVLTSFIALVGMRGPGMEFKEIYDTMLKPSRAGISRAWTAGMHRLGATVRIPEVPVRSPELKSFPHQLNRLIWRFNFAVNRALIAGFRIPNRPAQW